LTHEDLLQTLAELFIALVGFTGIVVALGRRGQGEWHPIERARLESLLGAGVSGIVFAIAPLVAASSGVSEALIWRTGNGVTPFLHVLGAARFMVEIGPRHWFDPGAERITTVLVPIPAALILFQLAAALGFFSSLGPFLYLAMLLWFLVVGLLQFVFLLIRTPAA
jgi:hypothetical protein